MLASRTTHAPVEDVVRALGYLTLGTRFKRLGERLQSHTQRILDSQRLAVPAGQFPFLAALDRSGSLTVGELADAVGVTQPGATRTVGQLVGAGLVTLTPAEDDQRRKSVALSPRGKRVVAEGKRTVWPVIERVVRDACRELDGSLLDQLASLEDALAAEPLDRRAARLLGSHR